ncbi:MAG TPA: glycoside hydrolase family 3 N-terminal domain-containing protein, partial [Pyrinomonadaceae bacterium]|nr:glycoside hydrolase family 3 N-terminal domain-containing protein [Pyrinomonadaceae bacterium]
MSSDQLFSLPFEEQVGQFFFIGLPGTEVDAEARELIEEIKPGGIILFGRNIETAEQVRKLLDDSRALVPTTLLCGIDQEGGLVDRLREIFPPMPSARALRQHGDLAGVRTLGRVTGELLRMLGLNINFAPVMSIITQERSQLTNGLYSRSFGSSPGEVLGYTTVYMRGLQGMGVLGCLKHFPGIGAGAVDSHIEMPVVPLSRDDLLAQDLAPYIELFQREDDRVRVVMVSHGGFPFIDIKKGTTGGLIEPASINSGIVTKLLRQELGYNHLVVTDDLEMGAIAKHCEIEEASVRAFAAGEDMLLICATPETIRRGYRALLKAAREQRISERRIQE